MGDLKGRLTGSHKNQCGMAPVPEDLTLGKTLLDGVAGIKRDTEQIRDRKEKCTPARRLESNLQEVALGEEMNCKSSK